MIVKTFRQTMLLNGSIVTIIYAIIEAYFILKGKSPPIVLPLLIILYLFVLLVHYLFWEPKYPG